MEILNPKVGTVPKKIREVLMAYKSPRALLSVLKISCLLNNYKNYLKNCRGKILFRNYALKIALFSHMHPTFLN